MKNLLILCALVALFSCNNEEENTDATSDCDAISINNELYLNGVSDDFQIQNVEVNEHCLEISIAYGGGCNETSASLVSSEIITSTDLMERNVRLLFVDNDDCEAWVNKTFSFDVSSLRIEGEEMIHLQVDGYEEPITYEY